MSADKYILAEEIKSTAKRGVIYGKAGEVVTEIIRTGHVSIVEDKKGERYSVNINKLIKTT